MLRLWHICEDAENTDIDEVRKIEKPKSREEEGEDGHVCTRKRRVSVHAM